jgi:hypothetical protein
VTADDHRAAAQPGIVALLDGRVERVHVEVDDRGAYSASSILGRFDFDFFGGGDASSEDEDG